jgi:hypothetical protein
MPVEAQKHMNDEINTVFCLTLGMQDTVPLTIVHCFF